MVTARATPSANKPSSATRARVPAKTGRAGKGTPPATSVAPVCAVDIGFLESLMGYNVRRASLVISARFMREMAVYGLRQVDFSVLSLIHHNPGITSRQLCSTLGLLPPNLVGMISELEQRLLVLRQPHPSDRRAVGLHLSDKGIRLTRDAEKTAATLEAKATAALSAAETQTLMQLLKRIYS